MFENQYYANRRLGVVAKWTSKWTLRLVPASPGEIWWLTKVIKSYDSDIHLNQHTCPSGNFYGLRSLNSTQLPKLALPHQPNRYESQIYPALHSRFSGNGIIKGVVIYNIENNKIKKVYIVQ